MNVQLILPIFILFVCIIAAQGGLTGMVIWNDAMQLVTHMNNGSQIVMENIVEARDDELLNDLKSKLPQVPI
ncbi:unnamed protein product [Caenorhabditis brenneri]